MDIELSKKQNRKMTFFACVLSFLSIGLLVFGFLLVSSEKVIMLQSISNLTNRLDQIVDQNQTLLDSISFSDDMDIYTWADLKVLNENLQSQLSFLEKKLFNLHLTVSNGKIYFPMKELDSESESEYSFIDLGTYSLFTKLSSNDYDKVLSHLKDAIRTVINNQDIQKEKVTVSYNGKDKKVNCLTYEITNQSINDMLTTFINYLKQDKTLIDHLSTIHSISNLDVNKKLDLLLESIHFPEDFGFTYHVYYYGFNRIFRYELETKSSTYQIAYQVDDQEQFRINHEDTCLFYLEIDHNKKQTNFSGYLLNSNQQEIPIKGNLKENLLTLILNNNQQEIQFVFQNDWNQTEKSLSSQIEISQLLDDENHKMFLIDFHIQYSKSQNSNLFFENAKNIRDIL